MSGCSTTSGSNRVELLRSGHMMLGTRPLGRTGRTQKRNAQPQSANPGSSGRVGPIGYPLRRTAAVPDLMPGLPDPLPIPELNAIPARWACLSEVRHSHICALRRLLGSSIPPPSQAIASLIQTPKRPYSIKLSLSTSTHPARAAVQVPVADNERRVLACR